MKQKKERRSDGEEVGIDEDTEEKRNWRTHRKRNEAKQPGRTRGGGKSKMTRRSRRVVANLMILKMMGWHPRWGASDATAVDEEGDGAQARRTQP